MEIQLYLLYNIISLKSQAKLKEKEMVGNLIQYKLFII